MLSRTDAILIIIDIQGNLAQAMYEKENLFSNNVKLIQGVNENSDICIAAIKSAGAHLTPRKWFYLNCCAPPPIPNLKRFSKL